MPSRKKMFFIFKDKYRVDPYEGIPFKYKYRNNQH